jgi:hypothetical protein
LKFQWASEECKSATDDCSETFLESHVCTPDEISKAKYDSGYLFFCPPADKLHLYNNYELYPNTMIKFKISPNYDETNKTSVMKEVNNFQVAREEMKSSADFGIIGKSPIISKAEWVGRHQLEAGKILHGDTKFRLVQL